MFLFGRGEEKYSILISTYYFLVFTLSSHWIYAELTILSGYEPFAIL